ncbi:MAG: diguanylate cyclase [Actinobacteria bacterium]|nr:diguanylate cyclase [Actinomycetota bacterium]
MRYAKFERLVLLVMGLAVAAMAVGMAVQKTDAVEVLGHCLMMAVVVAGLYGGRRGAVLSFLLCLALYSACRLAWRGDFQGGVLAQLIGAKFLVYGIMAFLCHNIRVQFRYFFVKMEEQDLVDDETQVGNARFLRREIEQRVLEHERYGKPFSLVFFSFDPALLSRTRGRGASLLRDVTVNVLKNDTRAVDELARVGDRLVVLLPNVGPEGARACAARLQDKIQGILRGREEEGPAAARTSTFSYPEDREAVEDILAELGENP